MGKRDAFDVLVVGEGIPALVAAIDCARIGLRTIILNSEQAVETRTAVSARDGVVADLCAEFGVGFDVTEPTLSEATILGIPGTPFGPSVRQTLGWSGSWRVYLDRLRPLLAIGDERNLARLVRQRIGSRALEGLVRPAVRAQLDCEPEDVDIVELIPELSPAMNRVGSLTLGVLELATADLRAVSLIAPRGGLAAIERALINRANYFAVTRVAEPPKNLLARVTVTLDSPSTNGSFLGLALDRAVPRARQQAADARHEILSDPDYRPIGPVDLED